MPSVQGVETAFSPSLHFQSPGATFQSPRPSKASNIRVVTRIRPLLEDEVARCRKVSIMAIHAIDQEHECSSPKSPEDQENTLHTTNRKFHPSKITPPTFQSENLLLQNHQNNSNESKTTSSLPPSKTSTRPPTSLLASIGHQANKQFDFDAVLDMGVSQQEVYATAVGDKILSNIFRGINVTIMAYGQTAAGKSYTMQGFNNDEGDASPPRQIRNSIDDSENQCPNSPTDFRISDSDGIIPRAIHDLFKGKMDYKSSGKGHVSIGLSYFELYNEEIRDLLLDDDDFRTLKMLDHGDSGVIIEGLTSIPIQSAAQVHELIDYAARRRATSSTHANVQSSRSHALCTLTVSVTPIHKSSGLEMTRAKLTLVDLAGSERIKKTGVVGVQQQESITINKDLFVLGKVVAALADKSRSAGKGKQVHVPFRDSKLTRLLRESLGGNCFTVLISCVSPADSDMEESINTLRYAERARSISNKIKQNVAQAMLTPQECASLTAENMRLKALVVKLKNRVAAELARDTAGSLLDQEDEEGLPHSIPKEIFRLDSMSTDKGDKLVTQHSSSRGERQDKPIWMHFKDLAKITKNVTIPPKQTRAEQSGTVEIELKEKPTSFPKEDLIPERCLSYEIGLLPSESDDLAESDDQNTRENQVEDQANELTRLTEENKQERETLDKLKFESSEIEASVQQKRDELLNLDNEIESKKTSIEQKNQELISVSDDLEMQKIELERMRTSKNELKPFLVSRGDLQEEAEVLMKLLDYLDISSPQRSFNGILKSFDLNQSTSEGSGEGKGESSDVARELDASFGELEDTFSKLEAEFRGQKNSAGATSETPVDLAANMKTTSEIHNKISNTIKLAAATIHSQKEGLDDLEQQLVHAKKQWRLSDRNKALADSQIVELQERVGELESEIESGKKERNEKVQSLEGALAEDKQANDEGIASYTSKIKTMETENKSLFSKLKAETERFRSLHESLNFMYHDYDSLASTMQQKLSDLKDECTRERALKSDYEYQVQALRKANADLRNDLEAKRSSLEQTSLKKADIEAQVQVLQGKLRVESRTKSDLECKLSAKATLLEQESLAKTELQIQVHALNEKLVQLEGLIREKTGSKVCSHRDATKEQAQAQESRTLAKLNEIATPESKIDTPQNATTSTSQQPDYIRMKAAKMLELADEAIVKLSGDGKSTPSSSCCSSAGTEFRPSGLNSTDPVPLTQPPILTRKVEKPPISSAPGKTETEKVQITNLNLVENHEKSCTCSSNLFAEKAEYVEFYLPKISVDCTCGRAQVHQQNENEDPCALESILRPWQVDFLAHVGIKDAASLVHACNHRGGVLATDLRRWRRKQGLPSVRTKSCGVALHIWSRTCKCVLRSVRAQRAKGLAPKKPEFLELNISENNTAVSSLGSGTFRPGKK